MLPTDEPVTIDGTSVPLHLHWMRTATRARAPVRVRARTLLRETGREVRCHPGQAAHRLRHQARAFASTTES